MEEKVELKKIAGYK